MPLLGFRHQPPSHSGVSRIADQLLTLLPTGQSAPEPPYSAHLSFDREDHSASAPEYVDAGGSYDYQLQAPTYYQEQDVSQYLAEEDSKEYYQWGGA